MKRDLKGALLGLMVLAAAPAGASDCGNFWGAKCRVKLATGVEMTYLDLGPPDGRPLVLLHGYTDSSLEWVLAAEALHKLDPGLRLLAVDQRGAGGTGLPDRPVCRKTPGRCVTQAEHVEDVAAFIAALGLKKPVLVGHSMGSFVARGVALAHPGLVDRLVLVGTGAPLPGGAIGVAGLPGAPRSLGESGPVSPDAWRKIAEARGLSWPQEVFDLRPIDLDPHAVEAMARYWDVSALAPQYLSLAISAQTALVPLKYWDIDPTPRQGPAEALDRLAVPALVLWGTQDAIMTRPTQDALLAALKKAAEGHPGLAFVWKRYGERPLAASGGQTDDIGHEIVWEAPDALARDIASYLGSGLPTGDDVHAEGGRIVSEPGKAEIVMLNGSSKTP